MVVAAAMVMILGIGMPVVANAMTLNTSSAAAASAAAPVTTASAQASAAVTPATGSGPHPGTMDVYEAVPGGATTEDPAIAYDVNSMEVLFNTVETLVNYNNSSTSTFVPSLATCIPGTLPCYNDYGAGSSGNYGTFGNFTGLYTPGGAATNNYGAAEYWTFVIDPAANFYDPTTHAHWGVYPTDVMFSVARTLAWSDFYKNPGWIIAQSLLPAGNPAWDGGLHAPYNNTPQNIYSSMLINDSSYCPALAMNPTLGHGCITFVVNGLGVLWPDFLDFVEDNAGSSVLSCGFYQYEGAFPGASYGSFKEPWSAGWGPTASMNASKGDNSCALPTGGNNTNTPSWQSYISTTISKTAWDNYEKSVITGWPAPDAKIQWKIVGSGPYYVAITPRVDYDLAANPAYAQPSGCNGNPTVFSQIGGTDNYCLPSTAPNGYIHNVDVIWETAKEGDTLGTSAVTAGTADFAGFELEDIGLMESDAASGLWSYFLSPSLSTGFIPINFYSDYTGYNGSGLASLDVNGPTTHILPANAMTDIGMRNLLINSFPYATFQSTYNTVAGIEFDFLNGGPIPLGMGNYYPTNITWPYSYGDPQSSGGLTGSAEWWWNQVVNNTGGPFYNATIATYCTPGNPCYFPIGYWDGEPEYATALGTWGTDLALVSQGALQLWPDIMTFTQFLGSLVGANESWLPGSIGFGWSPDYPDPTDYIAPMAGPNGDYTGPDAVSEQLANPGFNSPSCGHSSTATLAIATANLGYWAAEANITTYGTADTLTDQCQGVAYSVASYMMAAAGAMGTGPTRTADYNLIEQVTNELGLNLYTGQANFLFGHAPWIAAASINTNPIIGAGEINNWYMVRYTAPTDVLRISEKGLPNGVTWHLGVCSPGCTEYNNTTTTPAHGVGTGFITTFVPAGGPVTFVETQYYSGGTNATLAGYSPVSMTCTTAGQVCNWAGATVSSALFTPTLTFGVNQTVEFVYLVSQNSVAWPGAPSGSSWSVVMNPETKGANPAALTGANVTDSSGGTVIFTNVPVGLHFSANITSPAHYTSSPTKTTVVVGTPTVHNPTINNHKVQFKWVLVKQTFSESKLPVVHGATPLWSINITCTSGCALNFSPSQNALEASLGYLNITSTKTSIASVPLETGTYTVTYYAAGYTVSVTVKAVSTTSFTIGPPAGHPTSPPVSPGPIVGTFTAG